MALEIELTNGSRIILNHHGASFELWSSFVSVFSLEGCHVTVCVFACVCLCAQLFVTRNYLEHFVREIIELGISDALSGCYGNSHPHGRYTGDG